MGAQLRRGRLRAAGAGGSPTTSAHGSKRRNSLEKGSTSNVGRYTNRGSPKRSHRDKKQRSYMSSKGARRLASTDLHNLEGEREEEKRSIISESDWGGEKLGSGAGGDWKMKSRCSFKSRVGKVTLGIFKT